MDIVNKSYLFIKNLLVGEVCLSCGQAVASSQKICNYCQSMLLRQDQSKLCQSCGAIATLEQEHICINCLHEPMPWDDFLACFEYQGLVKTLLQRFKFQADIAAGDILANIFALEIKQKLTRKDIIKPDVMIAVPIHRRRYLQRGYNQCEFFSKVISNTVDIIVDSQYCVRTKYSKAQSTLSRVDRLNNLQDAFTIDASKNYKHVVVVEDVMTTGSTLKSICQILRKSKVEKISVWCLTKVIEGEGK